jgi:hypothetical protein
MPKQHQESVRLEYTTVCHFCGIKIIGAVLKWDGINVVGALIDHMSKECDYVNDYS